MKSGRFIGKLLGPVLKTGLPLMKNVLKSLAKSVQIQLRLTAAASATDASIQKNTFGSGMHPFVLAPHPLDLAKRTTLIISNKEGG